jgi:hypothetical protein
MPITGTADRWNDAINTNVGLNNERQLTLFFLFYLMEKQIHKSMAMINKRKE